MTTFVKGLDGTYLNLSYVTFVSVACSEDSGYCITCGTVDREIILKEKIESREIAEKKLHRIMDFFAKRAYRSITVE